MKKKITMIGLFALSVCAIAAGLFSFHQVTAEAATEEAAVETVAETTVDPIDETTLTWLQESFVMDYGASARVGTYNETKKKYENYGIRFSVTIDDENDAEAKAAFTNIAESEAITGVIIAPNTAMTYALDKVSDSNGDNIIDKNDILTPATVFGADSIFTFAQEGGTWSEETIYNIPSTLRDTDTSLNGVDTLHGAVINLHLKNVLQKYTGVAYVGVPVYGEDNTTIDSYTYYFAKYASGNVYETDTEGNVTATTKNDVSNNTRCMYYIAQKEIESTEGGNAALQESYITELQTTYATTLKSTAFKYTVVHHYYHGSTENFIKLTTAGGTLGSTVELTEKNVLAQETVTLNARRYTYEYDEVNSMGYTIGTVYAGGMQYLHMYYALTAEEASSLSNMLTAEGAMNKYFDGQLELNIDGDLEDTEYTGAASGLGGLLGSTVDHEGRTSIEFTLAFIYDLQQNGYSKITIGKLYATPCEPSDNVKTAGVQWSGYASGKTTNVADEIFTDADGNTNTRAYITEPIVIELTTILTYKNGKYYNENNREVTDGITFEILTQMGESGGFGVFVEAIVGKQDRDWIFDEMTVS